MRRLLVLLLVIAATAVGPSAHAAVATTVGQSTYLPQAPTRVLDTRDGTGGRFGRLGPGQTLDLTLPGTPPGATAAVLNVTATGASGDTVIRVYPTPASGTTPPTVSNLNVVRGVTVANLVVTRLGSGGRVRLRNDAGSVHLVADLAGFYVAGGSGDGFFGTAPKRLLDTRNTGNALTSGQARVLSLLSTASGDPSGVPTNADAVVLNVTAVAPTAPTVITVYPGETPPTVSNLNPAKGQVVANLVVVKVEDVTDAVRLLSSSGVTHVVVDLAGWYVAGVGDVFHPVDPFRVLDTRTTSTVVAGQPRTLVLAGATSLPWSATAMALNVTAVRPTSSAFVTAYPFQTASSTPPTASNINLLAGQVVPNAVVVAMGEGGAIRLASSAQSVDLVVDVAGWFGPAGDGWDISWPQCTSAGSTTSTHPTGGAFAVLGMNRGRPFTVNECFADEITWARGLPGGAAVYINVNAPGPGTAEDSSHWTSQGPRTCSGSATDANCGWNYGDALAGDILTRLQALGGPPPEVFLDVENGPTWQTAGVNGNVAIAAINRLKAAGYRIGIYSNASDWTQIMGSLSLPKVQDWTFAHTGQTTDPCSPTASFSGGPVVMRQIATTVSGQAYDVDHVC